MVMDDRKIARDFSRWAKKEAEWIHTPEGKACVERVMAEINGRRKMSFKDIVSIFVYIITLPLRIIIEILRFIFDTLEN